MEMITKPTNNDKTTSTSHPDMQNSGLEDEMPSPSPFKADFRVYAIIIGLGITNLLAALENTVVTIAAPVILTDLQLGDNFIWITNALFLSR